MEFEDFKRSNPLRYSKYVLPNGREVYLTQRPDSANSETVAEFIKDKNPIVRFVFCDDFVEPPIDGPSWHWLPWVPNKAIPIENVFAFVSMMTRYVNSEKSGSIWLHCDSSSMRAPTYFGIYLFSNFDARTAIKICKAMTVCKVSDFKYSSYSRADRYVRYSIDKDPGVKELINAWKKGGEEAAYKVYMGYPW